MMKKSIKSLNSILILGILLISCNQNKESQVISQTNNESKFHNLTGPYLGQKPPGMKAEIFAPGILSTGLKEICISFSADGNECFFVTGGSSFKGGGGLFMTRVVDNYWIEPERPIFHKRQTFVYPHISYNGEKLLFSSRWPSKESQESKPGFQMGYMSKINSEWDEPQMMTFGEKNESWAGGHVSEAANGNLYYQGFQEKDDIFVAKYENGKYLKPERLSDNINSQEYEGHPCIAPDESYLIFDASTRPDVNGEGDMYISFRDKNGVWLKAVNMGENVNSSGREYNPFVTYDGKYIFFSSNRMEASIRSKLSNKSLNYQELHDLQNSSGNGSFDIYWIDAKIIEELKPDELK